MDIDIDCVSSDEKSPSPSQEEVTMMMEAAVAGPAGLSGNENNPSESLSQSSTMGKIREYGTGSRKGRFNRKSKGFEGGGSGSGTGGQSNKERLGAEEETNIAHKNFFQGQLYDDFDLEKF